MNDASSARRLLEYMRAWQKIPASGSPATVRASADGDWWTPSVDAVRCAVEVEELVEALEDSNLRDGFETIRALIRDAVFSSKWQLDSSGQARETIPRSALGTLAVVVSALEGRALLMEKTSEFTELREFLLVIREQLMSADLPEETREYLLVLVSHLEQALAEAAFRGMADVATCADQLAGALTRLFVQPDGDDANKASGLVKKLVRKVSNFVNSPFMQAAIGSYVGTVTGQITTG